MSDQITRRSFLATTAGVAAAVGAPFALGGCNAKKTAETILVDAGPLIAVLMSGYSKIGMVIGTVLANGQFDNAAIFAVTTLYRELKKSIEEPSGGITAAAPVFTYGFGHLPVAAMSAFVTALWRTRDGKPASLTRAAKVGGRAFSIPTPAQFGVSLLASQYMANWKQQLEASGQCVSIADLASHTAGIFAPGNAPRITTPGVTELHVTEPAEYVYWTAGGAPVTINWTPSTDVKKRSSISASYKPVWGGPVLAVPVTEYQSEFPFDALWMRQSSSAPIIVNAPPSHPSYTSTSVLPTGSGTVQGTWTVKNSADGASRTVTGQGNFIEGMTGEFFLSLTGKPYGTNWVKPTSQLPMTMTYIPGDCAIYSGDVTLAAQSLTAELSGPSGVIKAGLLFTATPDASRPFGGVLTMNSV